MPKELTDYESDTLMLIARGKRVKTIATKLNRNENAIRGTLFRTRKKLGAHTNAQAVFKWLIGLDEEDNDDTSSKQS